MNYSVIIPVYNAEKTIGRCLDSIICAVEKSQQEVEIILVNDGSVDQSGAVCLEYSEHNSSDKAKIFYISQENSGPSAARNKGLSLSNGKYIVFVDSDDFISDEYFTVLESFPDADLIEFDYVKDSNNTSFEYKNSSIEEHISTRSDAVHSKRFKLSIIRQYKILFPIDLYIGEDAVFSLNYCVRAKSIIKTDAQLYYYDESQGGSLTRRYKDDACEQAMRIYGHEFDIIKTSELTDNKKQDIMRLLDYNYCRTMFVDVEELFRRKPRFSIKEFFTEERNILIQFKTQKEKWYRPINVSHFYMQLCVVWKLGFIVSLVSLGHYGLFSLTNKKKIYG